MVSEKIADQPLFLKLLASNDPGALEVMQTPEAVINVYALARFAAARAFALMGTPHELRALVREDAIQEAAMVVHCYRRFGPRRAYTLAKRRTINWIVTYVYGGKTRKVCGETGLHCPPPPVYLEDLHFEGEEPACLKTEREEEEPTGERELCIVEMYAIVYDLVTNHMGLKQSRHIMARHDALALQYTLRGEGWQGLAQDTGRAPGTARDRIRQARQRLTTFLEMHDLEEVAAYYRTTAVPDPDELEAYVARYLQEHSTAYQNRHGRSPSERSCQRWIAEARTAFAVVAQGV